LKGFTKGKGKGKKFIPTTNKKKGLKISDLKNQKSTKTKPKHDNYIVKPDGSYVDLKRSKQTVDPEEDGSEITDYFRLKNPQTKGDEDDHKVVCRLCGDESTDLGKGFGELEKHMKKKHGEYTWKKERFIEGNNNFSNISDKPRSKKSLDSPATINIPSTEDLRASMNKAVKDSKYKDDEREVEAFEQGYDRGVAYAEAQLDEISKIKEGMTPQQLEDAEAVGFDTTGNLEFDKVKNLDDVIEVLEANAYDSEMGSRDMSPFEFQAKELRDNAYEDDDSEFPEHDTFDAFEDGIGEGVRDFFSQFQKANKDLKPTGA